MIYSTHTFEISMALKTEKFYKQLAKAYEKARKGKYRIYQYDAIHIDEALKSKGIMIKYQNGNYKKILKFIVNPSVLLGGDDLQLWKPTEENIEKLLQELETHIQEYFDFKYTLNDYILSRIDFTVNIDVDDRKNVLAYIKVFHNLGAVKGFSLKYSKNDENIIKERSFDLEGNSNGIDFTAYDKEAESNRQKAKGILRVEVKLMKPKSIRKYTDETSISSQIGDLSKKSREIFLDVITEIVPHGDYYKMKQAKRIIEDTISKKKLREKMLKLMELIPKHKSLLSAQKKFNDRHIDEIMEKFSELNVSPVTISKRQSIRHLKSLYGYLE